VVAHELVVQLLLQLLLGDALELQLLLVVARLRAEELGPHLREAGLDLRLRDRRAVERCELLLELGFVDEIEERIALQQPVLRRAGCGVPRAFGRRVEL
jgi:hypothetical protein